MGTHYIDIHLLADPEFSQAHLLGALYSKLHRALVQLDSSDIGVSFPGYDTSPKTLGTVLRLHSTDKRLHQLLALNWLQGMHDHVGMTEVKAIPGEVKHRNVERRQFKTNVERLRRRRMARKGETAEQAAAAIPISVEKKPDLPYIQLRSQSNAQSFSLYVALGELKDKQVDGSFNTYGLGKGATVPWF